MKNEKCFIKIFRQKNLEKLGNYLEEIQIKDENEEAIVLCKTSKPEYACNIFNYYNCNLKAVEEAISLLASDEAMEGIIASQYAF